MAKKLYLLCTVVLGAGAKAKDHAAGEVVTVSDDIARDLLAQGAARLPAIEPAPAPKGSPAPKDGEPGDGEGAGQSGAPSGTGDGDGAGDGVSGAS